MRSVNQIVVVLVPGIELRVGFGVGGEVASVVRKGTHVSRNSGDSVHCDVSGIVVKCRYIRGNVCGLLHRSGSQIPRIIDESRNIRRYGRNHRNRIHRDITCIVGEGTHVGRNVGLGHIVVGDEVVLRNVVFSGEHTFRHITRIIGKGRHVSRNRGNGVYRDVAGIVRECRYVGRDVGSSHVVIGNEIILCDIVLGGEHAFGNIASIISKRTHIRGYRRNFWNGVHCNVAGIICERTNIRRDVGFGHVVIGNEIVLRDVVLSGQHTFRHITCIVSE